MKHDKQKIFDLNIANEEINPHAGGQTVVFNSPVYVVGNYSVVGHKERDGTFGDKFDEVITDEYFGESSHEGAERKMFERAITGAVKKSGLGISDVNMFMGGDLMDQITSSSFAARSLDMTYVGVYGACSTMALSLGMASCLVESGAKQAIVAAAGSHYATAERQFRTPLELGNQRPPTSQWTITGVGATVVSKSQSTPQNSFTIVVKSTTFGKVIDWGIKDANNMGAVMAPSAAHTLLAHFRDTKTKPNDYDAIFTGDLGRLGEASLRDLMINAGFALGDNYIDCGSTIYKPKQTQYEGGSGAGCSAIYLNSVIIPRLGNGEYKNVLFVATGALLSPTSSFQGNTIPGISHAVTLESV